MDKTVEGLGPLHPDDGSCFCRQLDLHSYQHQAHLGLEGYGWPADIGTVNLEYRPHVHPPAHVVVGFVTLCSVTVLFIIPP